MNTSNAVAYYNRLVAVYTPDRTPLDRRQCIQAYTHDLLQRGPPVRTQKAEHASFKKDLTSVYSVGDGRRIRSDAKVVMPHGTNNPPPAAMSKVANIRMRQLKKSPWRHHQSKPHLKPGRCQFKDGCPGLPLSKANPKRCYGTFYYCEECTAMRGKVMYFCNNTKLIDEGGKKIRTVCLCHEEYHKRNFDYGKGN